MKRFLLSFFTIVLLLAFVMPVIACDQTRDGPVIATAIMDMPDLAVLATTIKNVTMNFDPMVPTGAPLLLATLINKTEPVDQCARDVNSNILTGFGNYTDMIRPNGEGGALLRQGDRPGVTTHI